jgi:hypothetical protein
MEGCRIRCIKCNKVAAICCDTGNHYDDRNGKVDEDGACLAHDDATCNACCHGRPKYEADCPHCFGTGKVRLYRDDNLGIEPGRGS